MKPRHCIASSIASSIASPGAAPVALALALTLGAAAAQASAALPPIQHSGQAAYTSGGVGADEADAMQRASSHWPLTLEFAVQEASPARAAYAADVSVDVRNAQGHTALQTVSNGPFMLAQLPPGRYTITATLDGKSLHETATVTPHHATKATFVWPKGVDGVRS